MTVYILQEGTIITQHTDFYKPQFNFVFSTCELLLSLRYTLGTLPKNILHLFFLEHCANNTKVLGSIPIWAIHLRAGIDDPCWSLPTQNILCDLCELPTQRYWVIFVLEAHCSQGLSVMSAIGDTRFLDIMTVFTKCNSKSEFTGKHDCKLITSLSSALHNYSSHVVPLQNTSVFAAALLRVIMYIKW